MGQYFILYHLKLIVESVKKWQHFIDQVSAVSHINLGHDHKP